MVVQSVNEQRIDNTMESLQSLLANPCLDVVTSKIISHLDYPSVVACGQVSKDFQSFLNEDKRVWINLVKSLQQHEKTNPVWAQICYSFQDLSLDIETIKLLVSILDEYLRNGSDQYEDPIAYYGMKNEFDKVDYLVDMFSQVDPIGCFWLACTFGTLDIVEKVYAKGVDVNVSPEMTHCTALMASIINDRTDIAEFLLGNININILAVDAIGKTAFMYACEYGRYEIAKLFIRYYGINVNAYESDQDCKVAFQLAKANGHFSILGLLLEETNIKSCCKSEPSLQYEVQQVSFIFECFNNSDES